MARDVAWESMDDGYEEAARRLARFILTTLRAHPGIQAAPVETTWDFAGWRVEARMADEPCPILAAGWAERLKAADPEGYATAVEDITGFMWGWAVNAARYVLGLGPVANPALVEVEVG